MKKLLITALLIYPCSWVFSQTPSTPPTGISATPNPVCSGQSTQLTVVGGSLGTGAQWQWYTGSCGGTWIDSGATITVAPIGMTTYYVRAEGSMNTTSCVNVTVSVNSLSYPAGNATATPTGINPGDSTTLTVTGGSLGTGAYWQWYSGSCGGMPVGTGTTIIESPMATTTYYVRAEGACNSTSCVSVTVFVNPVGFDDYAGENIWVRFSKKNSKLFIDCNSIGTQPLNLKLLNLNGQVIFNETGKLCTGRYFKEIDLHYYPEGIYVMVFSNINTNHAFKVVIP